MARDNTNKWAAKKNQGININGKYFCVGILSYYYSTTKLIFILIFSNYNILYIIKYEQVLKFVNSHNKKTAETIKIHVGTAIL